MADMFTIAVIPAFNDREVIGSMVLDARAHVDQVIVVDDRSQDDTAALAKRAGAKVLSLHRHRGEATALWTGLMEAKRSVGSAVAVLEGKGKYLLGETGKVLVPIVKDEADLVIGTLSPRKFADSASSSCSVEERLVRPSGVWAVSSKALRGINLLSLEYGPENILDRLMKRNPAPVEVPMAPRSELPQASDVFQEKRAFWGRWATKVGLERPLLYLGLPGSLLALGGALLALLAMMDVLPVADALQLAAGTALILVGTLLVCSGFILNQMVLLRHRMRR